MQITGPSDSIAIQILRLADHQGRSTAVQFLRDLARRGAEAVVSLFIGWKELEPKHSILGIYAR